MKKIKLLTLLLLLTSVTAMFSQDSIIVIGGQTTSHLYARGLSYDGSYLTGQVDSQHHMFVWKRDGNILIENDTLKLASNPQQMGSNAFNVTSFGLVAGFCPNPEHVYIDSSGEQPERNSNVPTAALFNSETKKWTFLPVVSSQPLVYVYGSRAYSASDDGRTIVGCQSPGGEALRGIAGYWKKDTVSGKYVYNALREDAQFSPRGSIAKAVSGDGLVIGGFECEEFDFMPKPVLWISSDNGVSYSKRELLDKNAGVVEAVSHNGKYAALSVIKNEDFGYAALYNIEKDETTEIHTGMAAALAVSDNGVVVGHLGGLFYGGLVSTYSLTPGRHTNDAIDNGVACIFTKGMGVKPLKEFFDENNITYPTGFVFKAATGISADGKKICGHGRYNDKDVSFYAEIPEITAKGTFTAMNFSIESPAYGSILLTWDSVPEDSNFIGYKIFSANDTVSPIDTVTEISYRIDGLADGTHSYYVVSSYTSKDAGKTKTLSHTLGKKNIPIFEEFNYDGVPSLINASWDVSYNTNNESWYIDKRSGYPFPCAKFLSPLGGRYTESLTSPYFDATAVTSLRMAFSIVVPGGYMPDSNGERLYVEIFADSTWHQLDEMLSLGNYKWQNKAYNLDSYAGKNDLRVRFRIKSGSTAETFNWFLDNVEIADASRMFTEEDPDAISANYVKEENKTHVQWSDPCGFVNLRYSISDNPADVVSSVGNAGRPVIAANKYTAEDLSAFKDYKLTSISFLRGANPNASKISEPAFKWYVSQGDKRLFEQEVGSTEAGVRTTVTLDNPIAIDNTKPLYYGVEVVKHDSLDWPVATGYVLVEKLVNGLMEYHSSSAADGRANLFSVDEGNTWDKLSDQNGRGQQIFLLRATLAKDPDAVKKSRLAGYRVFRNDVDMLGTGNLTSLNNYIDTLSPSGTNCYKVQAFYTTGKTSSGEEACVVIESSSNEQTKLVNSNFKIYPSFIKNGETVTVEMKDAIGGTLRLCDAMGKTVYLRNLEPKAKQSVQMDIASGMYLLQVNNRYVTKL
ncbi:MAG: hypothetical protein LBF01_04745, partial [Bacteroidales bacterium]|nr:hypothetical protein [Bacteroidales bacterium]